MKKFLLFLVVILFFILIFGAFISGSNIDKLKSLGALGICYDIPSGSIFNLIPHMDQNQNVMNFVKDILSSDEQNWTAGGFAFASNLSCAQVEARMSPPAPNTRNLSLNFKIYSQYAIVFTVSFITVVIALGLVVAFCYGASRFHLSPV